jgi:hypothetical protein
MPQSNSAFTIGQVIAYWPNLTGVAAIALFAPEVDGERESIEYVQVAHNCSLAEDLIAVLSTSVGAVKAGEWAYCGSAPVTLPASVLPDIPFQTNSIVGGVVESAQLVEALVLAYRGLVSWEAPLPGRPGYLQSLLFKKLVRN